MTKKRERGGASFVCHKCEETTEVILTKRLGPIVARWRKCPHCGTWDLTKEVQAISEKRK